MKAIRSTFEAMLQSVIAWSITLIIGGYARIPPSSSTSGSFQVFPASIQSRSCVRRRSLREPKPGIAISKADIKVYPSELEDSSTQRPSLDVILFSTATRMSTCVAFSNSFEKMSTQNLGYKIGIIQELRQKF